MRVAQPFSRHHPSMREKSATVRVASRMSLRSRRRFARSAGSSAFTVTLSKKASTGWRRRDRARIAPSKSSASTAVRASSLGLVENHGERLLLDLALVVHDLEIGRLVVGAPVLLLLDAQDVGRAAIAGEQVLAVLGVEEAAERLDAADDHEQVVLAFEREHGIDEIVPRTLVAEIDLQAVGEEGEEV